MGDLSKRVQSEACRREEVRMEGIRMAQDVSLARAAKAKLKAEKVDAMASETQRIYHLRKIASEALERSMVSMKERILEQRTRCVFDADNLTQHMHELLASFEAVALERQGDI